MPSLADDVWKVATAAYKALSPTASSGVTKSAKVAVPQSAYPVSIFSGWDAAVDKMWLSDLPNSQNVQLNNRTRLAWHTTTSEGFDKSVDGLDASFLQSLIGYYAGTEGVLKVESSTPNYEIVVAQDKEARTANLLTLNSKMIFLVLDMVLGASGADEDIKAQCAMNVAEYLTDSKMSDLLTGSSGSAVVEYAKHLIPKTPGALIELSTRAGPICIKQINPITTVITTYLSAFSGIAALILYTPSLEAVGGTSQQLISHWNDTYTLNVCKENGVAVLCGTNFYAGSAQITNCNIPVGVQGGCNFLSYNINVGNSAALEFRLGGEDLNIRLDQQYGCIGTTANISNTVGSTFSYTLTSDDPFALQTPSTTSYTVTASTPDVISGTLNITFPLSSYNGQSGTGTATGTWSVTKVATAFPKCLRPLYKSGRASDGALYGGDTPAFFCPSYGDYWGCHYLSPSALARDGEWL
jgi:hypothetical protein